MITRTILRRLSRDARGATMVEFALVLPVSLIAIMGLLDAAHEAYVLAQLQGAMQQAGRNSTLERNVPNPGAVDDMVKQRVDVVARGAQFFPERLSYEKFSTVAKPETYTDNNPKNGKYDSGECFEDVNGNSKWDADVGRSGSGGANDVVLYTMRVRFTRIFPVALTWGGDQSAEISASTMLRNQPYDQQRTPTYVKC